MNKFLVGLITAYFIVTGCAGLTTQKSELSATYIETYATEEEESTAATRYIEMEEDIQIVKDWEADGTVDVIEVWIDRYHYVLALKIIDADGCMGIAFFVTDIEQTLTPEYKETGMRRPYVPVTITCEQWDMNRDSQINK